MYVENQPINWIDPFGLFADGGPGAKYRGHRDFTGGDYFNYRLEDTGSTSPYRQPERHFRELPVSEGDVANAIASCNKEAFERAMHRGQDYFTHYGKGYRWDPGNRNLPCWGYGHACHGTKPDEDNTAWDKAEAWTKRWVEKWNEKCGCKE